MSFKGAFDPPCNYCGEDHSVLDCKLTPKPKPTDRPCRHCGGWDHCILECRHKKEYDERIKVKYD